MSDRPAQSLLVIERILRDRDGIWKQIIAERELRGLTMQMLTSSVVSLAIYGAVLGASNSLAQAASSFVKLPLLFLATLAICLPTLYLFNLVFGARLSVMQAVTLIMVCITVISVLALAFAPISLFFLISAHNYGFFKLLNVSILVLSALVGLRFLTSGMRALNDHQEQLAAQARAAEALANAPVSPAVPAPVAGSPPPAPAPAAAGPQGPAVPVVAQAVPATAAVAGGNGAVQMMVPMAPPVQMPGPGWAHHQQIRPPALAGPVPPPQQRPTSMTLLYIWILLFGFVGTQLAWTLRPFFGDPGQPFALFRKIEGTFYADIIRTIAHLVTG
jgi:hypothetical protein